MFSGLGWNEVDRRSSDEFDFGLDNNMEGVTFWFTGLSGSGKTTLSYLAHELLPEAQKPNFIVLDGDVVRQRFGEFCYDDSARQRLGERKIELAAEYNRNGFHVLISGIAAKREWRKAAREAIRNYYEIYLSCPLDVVVARDVKGLYREQGSEMVGLCSDYEEGGADLVVHTDLESVECSGKTIHAFIRSKLGAAW